MGFIDRTIDLLQWARQGADTPLQPATIDSGPPFELEAKLVNLEKEHALLVQKWEDQKRISSEYFEVIERIESERDQWKEMFFEQSREHQTAQGMLNRAGTEMAQQLRAAVVQLNFFRKGAEVDPVQEPKCLEDFPKGLPEKYGERMKEMAASLSEPTNGLAERERIAAPRVG